MPAQDVDVVVVGMGPGGEHVASRLARAGLTVVGVEARLLGGECPYYACVPTKMMVRAAETLAEARRVDGLAGSAETRPDFGPVAARIRREATDDWDDEVAVRRFADAGGRFVRGRGRITAPGEATVTTSDGEQVFRARRAIVLNPGTEPSAPPVAGLAEVPYWTNRDAVAAERPPESLLVLGAGPVGCEFAQVFARFGSRVTVLEVKPRLVAAEEPEASRILTEVFRAEGVDVRTGVKVRRFDHDGAGGGFTATLESGEELKAQRLLVAAGRRTDLAALGVGVLGVDDQAATLAVDERMRLAPGVWAVGDVTGRGAFTHVSMYQARIAAADILGEGGHGKDGDGEVADYRAVPRVTFTDPEIGSVGLTEAAARERGLTVRTGQTDLSTSARGWIHRSGHPGLVKVVEDAERGVLVGATVVGPYGGEVLGALAVAVHGEVPTSRLRRMMFAYPTFHRAIESAVDDLASS
ncbi:dihydrolipoyl dehydrogenase family protein [Streptoalloteichus hindustanus]|uniref:Pyruvate/2-oxoglutarate dehydrogenase complex, dihydrolipoamide dehydrogenase (E3) component n=1 Tax=Streptoalloteichus hindustanus TaxID=2017 RepID=A0A1M5A7M4_STRHI|nr:NAD(P)/FAD-dependent oxidoreductase [Streptoalloteichus hindustanus]SHF26303.1 Pyruvate/2-oxoglutarate dehydrogenase complex, dihydrolipoamide dehydrogenase (E3) component [Streptoalloteichus hindustanus]